MAEEIDRGQRLLFSHPRLVEELIRQCIGGSWIECLDFSTLDKVSERDLGPDLSRREKDLLWRLRYRTPADDSGWFYVLLHLEFQSEPQRFMALRMVTYKVLLYEDLVRRRALTPNGLLPPVLSVVLYNGKPEWREATTLQSLVEPLPDLEPAGSVPSASLLDYRLIEGRAYSREELEANPSPLAVLFQLGQSRGFDDLERGIERLLEVLPGNPENLTLREAFAIWLSTVIIPAVAPGAKISKLHDLTEVQSMLEQSVIEWRDGWIEEGLQKGRQEGLQEGLQEGEARVLLRQLRRKFGSVPLRVEDRIASASAEQILEWADRVLEAETLDQVFES